MKIKWVIGVDEAGRGPLAGPVAVGVVMVPSYFNWKQLSGVNDSKKLSEKKREEMFEIAKKLQQEGKLTYAVALVSSKSIDSKGIVPCITIGIHRAINRVITTNSLSAKAVPRPHYQGKASPEFALYFVKLDGGLKAPEKFIHQETIIKGDAKEKVIGLASIIAKVTRDRYMVRISTKEEFVPYTFAQHKGYGTKVHREAIAQHGLSSEHRKTFCKNIKVL